MTDRWTKVHREGKEELWKEGGTKEELCVHLEHEWNERNEVQE